MYQNIFCTAHRGLVIFALFLQYKQCDLPPLRSHCGQAPPGRAVYIKAGTLTSTPPYKTTTSEYRLSYCYKKKTKEISKSLFSWSVHHHSSHIPRRKSSVVVPNTWNLDPDPGFWPNLDMDPDPGPAPDLDLKLCYTF